MPEQPAERLKTYRRKRDFTRTLEPAGADSALEQGCLYVMHKHAASHDHFDLRLEDEGVLRSWALPKGAGLEPGEKRLAVQTEDHPLEYGGFEGVIPDEEYGGGTVMLWDAGSWRINGKHDDERIDFELEGEKLKGAWTLVRTRGRGARARRGRNWLLIKRSDRRPRKLQPDDVSVASGRSMAEIARDRDNAWVKRQATSLSAPDAPEIPGARPAPFPASMKPQLATLADKAPDGDRWLHEIKFDGYRLLAHLDKGKVRFTTRNGHDWTARFPEQARQLERLPVDAAIVDGELVAMTGSGSSSFRALQESLSSGGTAALVFQVFDLVYLDGHDLAGCALLDRKRALARLIDAAGFGNGDLVRYSDHVRGKGAEFFEHACTLGLEGVISKRADARYASGRNRNWLKVKCTHHGEFVVGGYTRPAGGRRGFGSLLLGAFKEGELVYAGRVGTGFSTRQLEQLHGMLRKIETSTSPFAEPPDKTGDVHWVRPQLVAGVEFTERTRDGRLRHPSFRGLLEDRDPEDVLMTGDVDMQAASGGGSKPRRAGSGVRIAGVRVTHPDRIMYPEQGATKADLAHYYAEIADWALPWLANRPLTLLRCPEGRQKECFFQKHLGNNQAKDVPRVGFRESKGVREYAYARSIADVVSLVQIGVLEFHPFGCQVDDLEHPDMMVFDLDPSPELAWKEMLRATRELRTRIEELGLTPFLRTTGGKGLHVVVPLKPKADWDEVKAFAQAISERHAQDDPKRLTTNMSKTKRRGRIFIDYLRNTRGATAIASYSARAREGAPVAVPLRWDELGAGLRPDRYNIGNLRRRLGALKSDPWEDFLDARASLTARMRRKVGLDQ